MGLRLSKSFKLGGGVKLNLSKSGIGLSVGTKGARISVGPSGTRARVGIPGTGIGFEKRITSTNKTSQVLTTPSPYQTGNADPIPSRSHYVRYCSSCQKIASDQDVFCTKCGSTLIQYNQSFKDYLVMFILIAIPLLSLYWGGFFVFICVGILSFLAFGFRISHITKKRIGSPVVSQNTTYQNQGYSEPFNPIVSTFSSSRYSTDTYTETQLLPIANELSATWKNLWPKHIHEEKAQVTRSESDAFVDSFNPDTQEFKVGVFTTTTAYCSCGDFSKRKLPCKHMYAIYRVISSVQAIADVHEKYPVDDSKWGSWNSAIHNLNPQKQRQSSAKTVEVISLDRKKATGILNGYNVSLNACECPDFDKRKLPCKHIYRLKYELDQY